MIALNDRLSPNGDAVASEVIDGEAIIIDLATGVYYSMDGVGGSIWALIEAKRSLEEIVSAIVTRYDVSLEQAQTDVQQLAADLLQEGLAVLSEGESQDRRGREVSQEQKLPYVTPLLNTYRDMGDLLALDPPVPGLHDIPWKTSAQASVD